MLCHVHVAFSLMLFLLPFFLFVLPLVVHCLCGCVLSGYPFSLVPFLSSHSSSSILLTWYCQVFDRSEPCLLDRMVGEWLPHYLLTPLGKSITLVITLALLCSSAWASTQVKTRFNMYVHMQAHVVCLHACLFSSICNLFFGVGSSLAWRAYHTFHPAYLDPPQPIRTYMNLHSRLSPPCHQCVTI